MKPVDAIELPSREVRRSVAETVDNRFDDPRFPDISYRYGAAGPAPVIRGTGIRVQTLVVAVQDWDGSAAQTAEDYGLSLSQVAEALAFYGAHRAEIDALLAEEEQLAASALKGSN
ncbi:MAG TPA: DUF433 domain-containing protein [Thermoanaerobaculia bacterium]|nr:DUF433 domain-containing protein [Thermoanaerobaculia bacterium]